MYDAVEHGVGGGLLADHVVPVLDGDLRCDHCRPTLMPVFDDVHQYAARLGVERLHAEVVQDKQVYTLDAFQIRPYRALSF